jgi:uncharacterized protein (DUF433 family)
MLRRVKAGRKLAVLFIDTVRRKRNYTKLDGAEAPLKTRACFFSSLQTGWSVCLICAGNHGERARAYGRGFWMPSSRLTRLGFWALPGLSLAFLGLFELISRHVWSATTKNLTQEFNAGFLARLTNFVEVVLESVKFPRDCGNRLLACTALKAVDLLRSLDNGCHLVRQFAHWIDPFGDLAFRCIGHRAPVAVEMRENVRQSVGMSNAAQIAWEDCNLVERVPGKVSGQPIIKGTRILADVIVEEFESGCPLDEIQENYPKLSKDTILQLVAFAHSHKPQPQL